MHFFDFFSVRISGKHRRLSKYDEEYSDGQLGINDKELNSMNKHIPGKPYMHILSPT